jgi:hypothetical protein
MQPQKSGAPGYVLTLVVGLLQDPGIQELEWILKAHQSLQGSQHMYATAHISWAGHLHLLYTVL